MESVDERYVEVWRVLKVSSKVNAIDLTIACPEPVCQRIIQVIQVIHEQFMNNLNRI
jgi:hypothetical protein